jgi:hypothetical protein
MVLVFLMLKPRGNKLLQKVRQQQEKTVNLSGDGRLKIFIPKAQLLKVDTFR